MGRAFLVGWVPEERRIVPSLSVRRNLDIARKRTRFRQWTLGECCEIFSALAYLLERESENLSGGEMQMVAISRALISPKRATIWAPCSTDPAARLT